MILLSSYLLYKNYESFKRAKDFRRDVDTHQYEFESLREELVPIKDYVDKDIVPLKWKHDNRASIGRDIERSLAKMSRYSNVILSDNNKDITLGRRIWSPAVYGFAAAVVSVTSFFTKNTVVIVVTCVCGLVAVAFSGHALNVVEKTREKSERLKKDTTELCKDIKEYRFNLKTEKCQVS